MSAATLKQVATGQQQAPRKTILDYFEDPRVRAALAAVAGKYLHPERMLTLSINAIKRTPKLLQCDPKSVLGAVMTTTALGLEPNTIQQQAFLIPYKRRAKVGNEWIDVYECQFQIGARGFVTLAYRSPVIKSIDSEAIHRGDTFEHLKGSQTFLKFAKALGERGPLIGSYSHAHLRDGMESAYVLPLDEIMRIRARSETWRSLTNLVAAAENAKDRAKAEAKLAETPWVMWEDDMAAKSALKKHAKSRLPIASNDALARAAAIDDAAERLDLSAMSDPDLVREVVNNEADPPALEHDTHEEREEVFGDALPAQQQPATKVAFEQPAERRPEAARRATPQQPDSERPQPTYAALADRMLKAATDDDRALILDEGRALPAEQQAELAKLAAKAAKGNGQ